MFRSSCALACFVGVCLSLLGAPARAQDAERLRIHGSDTVGAAIMPALVRSWLLDSGYSDLHERQPSEQVHEIAASREGESVVVEIVGNGTAAGFSDLIDQKAELAMATRSPTPAEREAAWQLGDLDSPDQAFTVALGGVQFVVDARSPVRALSTAQLREIYSGRIARWSAVGGEDRPIRAVWAGPRTASGEMLQSEVMKGVAVRAQVPLGATWPAGRDDIRVIPLSQRVPRGMRALAVSDGGVAVLPDRAGVLSEDYPLVHRYTLNGGPIMSALGRSLAVYSVGYQGQKAVEKAGALAVMLHPLRIAPNPVATQQAPDRRGGSRLPVSLRFHPEGIDSILDSRAMRDIERIDALLHSPAMRGRTVAVSAFVDRQPGGRMVAEQFANDRADYVANLLLQRGVSVSRARGFGARSPLASGPNARHRNERVEVWLL